MICFACTGEIKAQHPDKKITLVQSADRLLNNSALPLIEKAVTKVLGRLTDMGVEVKLNTRLTELPAMTNNDSFVSGTQTYTLSDGTTVEADLLVMTVGGARREGNLVTAADEKNQVKVDAALMVEGMPNVFCIGDANNCGDTKLGYLAGKQADLTAKNLVRVANGKEPLPYKTMDGQTEFGLMFVPLGPTVGVSAMGKTVLGNSMTSTVKGKGLFSKKVFSDRNAALPVV